MHTFWLHVCSKLFDFLIVWLQAAQCLEVCVSSVPIKAERHEKCIANIHISHIIMAVFINVITHSRFSFYHAGLVSKIHSFRLPMCGQAFYLSMLLRINVTPPLRSVCRS